MTKFSSVFVFRRLVSLSECQHSAQQYLRRERGPVWAVQAVVSRRHVTVGRWRHHSRDLCASYGWHALVTLELFTVQLTTQWQLLSVTYSYTSPHTVSIQSMPPYSLTYITASTAFTLKCTLARALQATLIVSRRVCLSTTLTLNISEIKRFRGSCLIGTLQVSATARRLVTSLVTSRVYDVILVTSQSSNPSRSETKIQINYPCEPFDHTVSWNVVFHSA